MLTLFWYMVMTVYPVWNKSPRAPTWTLALVLLHAAAFLGALTDQENVRFFMKNLAWQSVSVEMLKIARDPRSGLRDEERPAVQDAEKRSPFPPPQTARVFDRIESESDRLPSSLRARWKRLYPLYSHYRALFVQAPPPATFWTSWVLTPDGPLWPALPAHPFFHDGFWDVITTLLFLSVLGAFLEQRIGGAAAAVYLAGGVISAAARLHFAGERVGTFLAGDAGALCALIGAALVVAPAERIRIFYLPVALVQPHQWGSFQVPFWLFALLTVAPAAVFRGFTGADQAEHIHSLAGLLFGVTAALPYRFFSRAEADGTAPHPS